MSLKINFRNSQLNFLPTELHTVSNENGVHFHHQIFIMAGDMRVSGAPSF
jgi:hypothetical protein